MEKKWLNGISCNLTNGRIFGAVSTLKKSSSVKRAFFLPLVLLILTSIFFSCEEDDDYYSLGDIWISMGFIEQASNDTQFTVLLDNGDTLVPVANAVPYFVTKNKQRVITNYTILDEVGQSTKKFYVKINNLSNVLYKDIIELTASNNDSLGHDPVHIDDIWKSNGLLNIEFSFLGGDVTHYINLVSPKGDINQLTQPIVLELRHNARNDQLKYKLNSIVTFDLRNIKIDGQDSVSFQVKSIDYEGNEHTFNSTYHY